MRAVEPQDLDLLYEWENDTELWSSGASSEPYSRYVLKQYIAESNKDVYEKKQLRFMIERSDKTVVGIIDLFDFDPFHSRAAVGILIGKEHHRQGYASEALELLIGYAQDFLNIHQLYAHITNTNKPSLRLFEKLKFQHTATLQSWIRQGDEYIDVCVFQKSENISQ